MNTKEIKTAVDFLTNNLTVLYNIKSKRPINIIVREDSKLYKELQNNLALGGIQQVLTTHLNIIGWLNTVKVVKEWIKYISIN